MCWSAIELDKQLGSLLNISIVNLLLRGDSLKTHREIPGEKSSCWRSNKPDGKFPVTGLPGVYAVRLGLY